VTYNSGILFDFEAKALNGRDIEKNVWEFYRKKSDIIEEKLIIIAKIILTDNFQNECLDYLEEKQISHSKLFPDYQGSDPDYHGAVESCIKELGIDQILKKDRTNN